MTATATHGNDAGAIVWPILGQIDRDHVVGRHVTQIFSFPKGEPGEFDGLTQEEFGYLQFGQAFVEHAIHDRSRRTSRRPWRTASPIRHQGNWRGSASSSATRCRRTTC